MILMSKIKSISLGGLINEIASGVFNDIQLLIMEELRIINFIGSFRNSYSFQTRGHNFLNHTKNIRTHNNAF